MPIGDDAAAAGFPLVPNNGAGGLVMLGAQEINRTRDEVAQTKAQIPVGKSAYRNAAGIYSGSGDPLGGNDGDVFFKYIP